MNVGLVTNGYFTQAYGARIAFGSLVSILLFVSISLFIQHKKFEIIFFGVMVLVIVISTILLSLVALQTIGSA